MCNSEQQKVHHREGLYANSSLERVCFSLKSLTSTSGRKSLILHFQPPKIQGGLSSSHKLTSFNIFAVVTFPACYFQDEGHSYKREDPF